MVLQQHVTLVIYALLVLVPLATNAWVPTTLPWWHPKIQAIAVSKTKAPSNHSLIDPIVRNYESGHTRMDGASGLLLKPKSLRGRFANRVGNKEENFHCASTAS